jgi:hypothetical protein
MRNGLRLTALVAAAAVLLAVTGVARADDRNVTRRGPSTTEKVIAGITVAAVVGLTAYAISRSSDRQHRDSYYSPRQYVAVSAGFRSYSVGNPAGPHYRYRPRGQWFSHNGLRFWRVPYVYNPSYNPAFNAGWERGYWAGYLQGLNDSRLRGAFMDRFYWDQRNLWGYSSGFGPYSNYEQAFHMAFRVGYRHGFRGYQYGYESFGFGSTGPYHR